MRLRHHRWVVMTLGLCLAPFVSASDASNPACEPSAQTQAIIAQFSIAAGERARASGDWEGFEQAFESQVASHPSDVYLQRHWQDLHRQELDGLVERYRLRASESPEDPMSLYLYGRILGVLGRLDAEAPLLAALEADPQYPWAHLGLGRFYEVSRPDPEKAQSHIAAFIDQCPTSPVSLGRLRNISDPELARHVAASVRSAFVEKEDPTKIQYLMAVWAAEFKAIPPAQHAEVRERIARDLEILRKPEFQQDPRALQALLQGYALVGDDEKLTQTIADIARLSPYDPSARRAAMQLFHERHPDPGYGEDSPESREYHRELAAATKRWCEMWPDDPEVWQSRFQALSELQGLPADELIDAADTLLAKAAKRPDFRAEPLVPFQVARVFVDRDIELDRIPGLVEQGLQQLEAGRPRIAGTGPESAMIVTEIDQMLAYQGWGGREALFDAYLKQGRLDDARATLAKMEELLPQVSDVGVGEWGGHQFRHLSASWLVRSAALARVEERTADALLYYSAALTFEPVSPVVDRDAFDELWRELGGTEQAVQAWSGIGGKLDVPLGEPKELELPEFEFQDIAGKTWRLSDLRGKVVLLNVWASWCPPCLDELPWLQKLHDRLQDNPNLVVLTFNVDENPGVVEPMMSKNGYDFPVVFAFDYMLELWGHQWAIPCTWIVDPRGTARLEISGFGGDKDGWLDKVVRAMVSQAS